MGYAAACYRRDCDRLRYQCYITDTIKMIAENTAKYAGGMAPSKRYADLVHPAPIETRSAGEIIDNICAKLDAMGKEEKAFGCV